MKFVLRLLLALLFLPFILVYDTFRSPRSVFKKILIALLTLVVFGLFWIYTGLQLVSATGYLLYQSGITDKITNVPVSGTSMLPTLQDGQTVDLHSPKKFKIERGDIVTFKNVETGNLSFIKRVIGLPGDQLMIYGGHVDLNGQQLTEDYVYKQAPTFGNTFLVDCESYTVPSGQVAVFGDNRLVSMDSRIIGFVSLNDITGVLKTGVSPGFGLVSTSPPPAPTSLDTSAFVTALNQKRKNHQSSALYLNPVLTTVANGRAGKISQNINSVTTAAGPLVDDLKANHYDYLVVQEVVTMGNYTPDQLVDHVLNLYPYSEDFLSGHYYDIGVGTSVVTQGQCQIPVIDIILAWPPKPSDSQQQADNLSADIAKLTTLSGTFKSLLTTPGIPVSDTQSIIDSLSSLLDQANQLHSIALENRWLTPAESQLDQNYTDGIVRILQQIGDYVGKYQNQVSDPQIKSMLNNYRFGNIPFNEEAQHAQTLFGQGQYQDQLASAAKLLTLAKTDQEKSIAYYWQGLAYYSLNQYQSAQDSDLQAVKLDPTYAAAYSTLSAIALQTQKYDVSVQYAQKCLQLDPTYAWCYNNLGLAYGLQGNKDLALQNLQKAVSLDPTSYSFNDNLKRMKASFGVP